MKSGKSHSLLYGRAIRFAGTIFHGNPAVSVPSSNTEARPEFDYRELANWQDLQNLAMAYFTLVASPYGEISGGGGGGSQSDLKWGRDPEEDEIDFARRCAREASRRITAQKKSGMKRR